VLARLGAIPGRTYMVVDRSRGSCVLGVVTSRGLGRVVHEVVREQVSCFIIL